MSRRSPANDLVNACLDALRLHGCVAWRANNVPVYDPKRGVYRKFNGRKGVADVLGVSAKLGGRLIAVEAKSGSGKLSPDQRAFLADVEAAGGISIVARSVGDVLDRLKELGLRE